MVDSGTRIPRRFPFVMKSTFNNNIIITNSNTIRMCASINAVSLFVDKF